MVNAPKFQAPFCEWSELTNYPVPGANSTTPSSPHSTSSEDEFGPTFFDTCDGWNTEDILKEFDLCYQDFTPLDDRSRRSPTPECAWDLLVAHCLQNNPWGGWEVEEESWNPEPRRWTSAEDPEEYRYRMEIGRPRDQYGEPLDTLGYFQTLQEAGYWENLSRWTGERVDWVEEAERAEADRVPSTAELAQFAPITPDWSSPPSVARTAAD
ncbi:hypothetical protein FRC08_012781 [Ceratobasidium sp. 394]|nr:hypothetical protein FRC08_012781 [Ceratobasidium sp. 394]